MRKTGSGTRTLRSVLGALVIAVIAVAAAEFEPIATTRAAAVSPLFTNTTIATEFQPSGNGGAVCLDAELGTIGGNGTIVQLWYCLVGKKNQEWSYNPADQSIVNTHSGRCLDADTHTSGNGAKVQLWDCNHQQQQAWSYMSTGTGWTFKNLRDGLCLDANANGNDQPGTRVQRGPCDGSSQQDWTNAPFTNTYVFTDYAPTGGGPARCLDADLNTIGGNGTKVQLWQCTLPPVNHRNQLWYYNPTDHSIVNEYSGRCLDADTTTSGNGARVQLWDCDRTKQQTWSYSGNQVGLLSSPLQDARDGLCLDANTTGDDQNGTRVQRWACNGDSQQLWTNAVG